MTRIEHTVPRADKYTMLGLTGATTRKQNMMLSPAVASVVASLSWKAACSGPGTILSIYCSAAAAAEEVGGHTAAGASADCTIHRQKCVLEKRANTMCCMGTTASRHGLTCGMSRSR